MNKEHKADKKNRIRNANGLTLIKGWKALSKFTGYHERWLRNLHYTRARLPIIKTKDSYYSRWIVTPEIVLEWFKIMGMK